MRGRLDGRAAFGLGCALASLLVFANPAAGVFFGLVGAVFAISSVVSTDQRPSQTTRRVALVATLVCVVAFVIGLIVLAHIPQN